MSRRHRPRNNYPEGYAEHNVEMDWRKERDAEVGADDPDQDVARLRVLNAVLRTQLDKTTARAEFAEHSARRAWRYVAAALIVGIFIGYIAGFITK